MRYALSQTCSIYDPEYCPLKGYDAIVMNVDLNRLDNLENHKMNKHNGATMSHQKADAQTVSQTCSTYDPEHCLDTKSLPPILCPVQTVIQTVRPALQYEQLW